MTPEQIVQMMGKLAEDMSKMGTAVAGLEEQKRLLASMTAAAGPPRPSIPYNAEERPTAGVYEAPPPSPPPPDEVVRIDFEVWRAMTAPLTYLDLLRIFAAARQPGLEVALIKDFGARGRRQTLMDIVAGLPVDDLTKAEKALADATKTG